MRFRLTSFDLGLGMGQIVSDWVSFSKSTSGGNDPIRWLLYRSSPRDKVEEILPQFLSKNHHFVLFKYMKYYFSTFDFCFLSEDSTLHL